MIIDSFEPVIVDDSDANFICCHTERYPSVNEILFCGLIKISIHPIMLT